MQIADKPIWLSRAKHVHDEVFFMDDSFSNILVRWNVFRLRCSTFGFIEFSIYNTNWFSPSVRVSVFFRGPLVFFCYCHCVCCISLLFLLLFCFAINLTFENGCQKKTIQIETTWANERTIETNEENWITMSVMKKKTVLFLSIVVAVGCRTHMPTQFKIII